MGAQQTPNEYRNQTHKQAGVSFLIGGQKVHVLILRQDDAAQRNAIVDALLSLSTLESVYQLVYLAAPRLFGATLDASIFRSRGIGLLFFDERRIDEALPPQPMQARTATEPSPPENNTLVTELATLKSMYREMEHTLNALRDDLTSLRHSRPPYEDLPVPPEPVRAVTTPAMFSDNLTKARTLPPYFANNPWLEVLSKRGSGGDEAIAG
jgi:hypothetical protein